ncbi:hypothetical protein BDW66DRAFT_155490 [Aspergillus desertorum]
MEPSGLVLATIPLIVRVLDKYVDTLNSVLLIRTGRYCRYIERYFNVLEGQQASLVNAIEIALGIQISEDEIRSIRTAQRHGSDLEKRALQGTCTKPTLDLNDEQFRAAFYGLIVTPLMDIMDAFDSLKGTYAVVSLGI